MRRLMTQMIVFVPDSIVVRSSWYLLQGCSLTNWPLEDAAVISE